MEWAEIASCGASILAAWLLTQTATGVEPATQPAMEKAAFVRRLDAGTPQKIVYFGTSLTAAGGWSSQASAALEKAYPRLVTFHNGAQSGENSAWGLSAVQKNVVDQQPDVVFIEFTTNDAVDRFNLSIEQAKANTNAIINAIRAARPECEIILQVMNPVIDRPPGHSGHRSNLASHQQLYRDLAKERGLLLIDHMPAWTRLLEQGEPAFRKYVPDGLHPNSEGYTAHVIPTILRAIGIKG